MVTTPRRRLAEPRPPASVPIPPTSGHGHSHRIPRPPGPPGAAGPGAWRLPAGHPAGPVRDGPVSAAALAGLTSSSLFTRVSPGPSAPEGALVMRQFPPRECPGWWPGTAVGREEARALLTGPPFRLGSRGAQRQRGPVLGRVLDFLRRAAPGPVEGTPGGPRRPPGPAGPGREPPR